MQTRHLRRYSDVLIADNSHQMEIDLLLGTPTMSGARLLPNQPGPVGALKRSVFQRVQDERREGRWALGGMRRANSANETPSKNAHKHWVNCRSDGDRYPSRSPDSRPASIEVLIQSIAIDCIGQCCGGTHARMEALRSQTAHTTISSQRL